MRPVTPLGILTARLGRVVDALDGSEPWAEELRAAHALAAGLDPYVERCTSPESPALTRLRERTGAEDWDRRSAVVALEEEMLSGHVEGQFLQAMVHATRATRVLEIGTFTGYATLAMAEVLPAGGRLVACEIDPGVAAMAREHIGAAGVAATVEVRVGPALDALGDLAREGARFDLVFIDADKAGYTGYLEAILDAGLLEAHGLICVDNTLLQGEPWATAHPSTNGAAIAAFNEAVAAEERVAQVVVPLRDGLTLIRPVGAP